MPEIVFSAHSLPQSIIDKGDPYQREIEETVQLLMERGGWSNHHRLCYQSKVGASKWLQPSLHRTLRDLAAEGIKDLCIVPVSFVSDHVETLGPQSAKKTAIGSRRPQQAIPQRAAVERHGRVEVGMTGQERLVTAVDDPGEVSLRVASPQGCQDRQGVQNVSQRAGLDERDAPGVVVVQRDAVPS